MGEIRRQKMISVTISVVMPHVANVHVRICAHSQRLIKARLHSPMKRSLLGFRIIPIVMLYGHYYCDMEVRISAAYI